MTIFDPSQEPRGSFSPTFTGGTPGSFSPSFSFVSDSRAEPLFSNTSENTSSPEVSILEKYIEQMKNNSQRIPVESGGYIKSLEEGIVALKSHLDTDATQKFQSIIDENSNDELVMSCAHLGCAIASKNQSNKEEALLHYTAVFELEIISDQQILIELVNLSIETKDLKKASEYSEILFSDSESRVPPSLQDTLVTKYINLLIDHLSTSTSYDSTLFDEGFGIVQVYEESSLSLDERSASVLTAHEILGKFYLLYALNRLKFGKISDTKPMVDEHTLLLPSDKSTSMLLKAGIDHFVSLVQNRFVNIEISTSIFKVLLSIFYHTSLDQGISLENGKALISLFSSLYCKDQDAVNSELMYRFGNIFEEIMDKDRSSTDTETILIFAKIYFISLWKDQKNHLSVKKLSEKFSLLGRLNRDNQMYLIGARNCEEYYRMLTGSSVGSSITNFSSLARTFPYDFGMSSAGEIMERICSMLDISTSYTNFKDIFKDLQLDKEFLEYFQQNGGLQSLIQDCRDELYTLIDDEQLVLSLATYSPRFETPDAVFETMYSGSMDARIPNYESVLDILPDIFASLTERQKEYTIEIYNDVIKIYTKWRESETFRYHYFTSVEETNGQTPVLGLEWNTTKEFVNEIREYLSKESNTEKKNLCYSVVHHIFSNFITFNSLDELSDFPSWLISLQQRDQKLFYIVNCSIIAEDDNVSDSELSPSDQTQGANAQVLQPHILGLYYLQNLFLNSLSDHLDEFLKPEFKLFDEDKYLTFTMAKCGYRVGLNPFIVHYSPMGWPVSISRDDHLVGEKFLSKVSKFEGELPVTEHGQIWLTTNQTYHFCEHLGENGLEVSLEDDRSIKFTIIPEQSYQRVVPEALPPDDVDSGGDEAAGISAVVSGENNVAGDVDPLVNDAPAQARRARVRRQGDNNTRSVDLSSRRTLISEILDKIRPSESDDFISLMSLNGVKRLSMVHKKLSERQANIDAQYQTKINCSLSEALKNPYDEDLAPPSFLNLDGVFTLKPYQMRSLKRLLQLQSQGVSGGIIALEMGLGKTAIMGEYIMHMMKARQAPSLFFCPKSVVKQTVKKLQEYFIVAQINQLLYQYHRLDEVIEDGNYTRSFNQRLGIIDKYLHHLNRVCTELNFEHLQGHINELKDLVEIKYQELTQNGNFQRWSPVIIDERTGLFIPKNINLFFNTDESNNDNCHLLAIHPINDIVEMNGHLSLTLNRKNKIVVTNIDTVRSVLSGSKGIENISWGTVFFDEAQSLHNVKKQIFKGAERLKSVLQKKKVNTSIILSTGTPYQNYDGDLFTLMHLLDPCKEYEADDEEFFKLDRLQNLFETKRHETLKLLFSCLKYAKDHRGFRSTRRSYRKFQDAFLHLIGLTESFKAIVNKLAIIIKRDDVRDQWGGNIPEVTTTNKELRFIGDAFAEQKRILQNLNSNFMRRYSSTMNNLENLRGAIDNRDAGSRSSGASFFTFIANVSRAMIHPEFHGKVKSDREALAKNLAKANVYSTEEVRDWVNQSILLHSLFSENFEQEMEGGCVIFVDELAPGFAIESCIKRLYPEANVSFLRGETSQENRELMVEHFESENPNNEQRVLIIMSQSGATGTDLRKNGRTVHICYYDFNPGNIEQAKSRLIRANSPKEHVNIYFHYIEDMYFSQCVQRHRSRKVCMEQYFFEPQTSEPLSLQDKASKVLRSLLLELSPSLVSQTDRQDRIQLRNALLNFIDDNSEQIQNSIDNINPLLSEKMQEVVMDISVDTGDDDILTPAPMTPQHRHHLQPHASPYWRSPTMTPFTQGFSPRGGSFSPTFAPSPMSHQNQPTLPFSPPPESFVPMSPRYTQTSQKRLRDPRDRVTTSRSEERNKRPRSQTSGKRLREGIDQIVGDDANKRQKTHNAQQPGSLEELLNLSSLSEAATISQEADAMKRFLIDAKLREEIITDSKIELKLKDSNQQVIEHALWCIIPVLRNPACFGPQGISAGNNLIQAIDFGLNLLGKDQSIIFRGVIPSLQKSPRVPMVARVSHNAVGRFDSNLQNWLISLRSTRPLPTEIGSVLDYLKGSNTEVVIYKIVYNPVINGNSITKRTLLNLEKPEKAVFVLESSAGETSHYDLLVNIPPEYK